MTLYKALTPDRLSFYDRKTKWELGVEMPPIKSEQLGPCGQGYHLAKSIEHAVSYAKFPMSIYAADALGDRLGEDETKVRHSSARIIKEIKKPSWVTKAEKFIASIPSVKYLSNCSTPARAWKMFDTRAAARAAAGAAAGDAAWDAARAAAGAAAGDAAWDAARAAAGAAAGDAARAAAGAAARDAARAAAGDAARAAAGDAARAAARDAARDAQLMAYMEICSDLKIDKKHRKHAKDRWAVWQAGYGLFCDVKGEMYVYKRLV